MTYAFTFTTPAQKYAGTIHTDVLGVTQDGGLVVRFTQDVPGQPSQTFAPADCAVYADTRVQCQKANALGAAENELGHLLGRKFVNGDNLDDKNHWQIAGDLGGGKLADDFTVTSNTNGILNINESRDFTVQGSTTHHTAQITYDLNKSVPTKLNFTDANQAKPDLTVTGEYTLQSDTMGAKA